NLGTAARAHRAHGVHFLLVQCVLKCGVYHTLGPTSASLNYGFERFHGHQRKTLILEKHIVNNKAGKFLGYYFGTVMRLQIGWKYHGNTGIHIPEREVAADSV
ncbi:unnamed protein product, partial [Porites evermanni]